MPITVTTTPIRFKDNEGNYVPIDSFTYESSETIKQIKESSIEEITTAAQDAVNEAVQNIDITAAVNEIIEPAIDEAIEKLKKINPIKIAITHYTGPSTTLYSEEINEDMEVINYYISNENNIQNNLTINIQDGSITIEGTLVDSTLPIDMVLFLSPIITPTISDTPNNPE